jgi:hypothetical protein
MAIVKYSGIITSINGKVGGSVYQTGNTGIGTLRSMPIKRKTPNVATSKGYAKMSLLASTWKSFTQSQLDNWATYGFLLRHNPNGRKFPKMSPWSYFVNINKTATLGGGAIITTAYAYNPPPAISAYFDNYLIGATSWIFHCAASVPANSRILIYVSPYYTWQSQRISPAFKYAFSLNSGIGDGTNCYNLLNSVLNIRPINGQMFFVKVVQMSTITGQVTLESIKQIIVSS